MLIRRVGVLVALSISLAACSPQEVQPDSESAPAVSARSAPRSVHAVQPRYRSNYDEDSGYAPRRQANRSRPGSRAADPRCRCKSY